MKIFTILLCLLTFLTVKSQISNSELFTDNSNINIDMYNYKDSKSTTNLEITKMNIHMNMSLNTPNRVYSGGGELGVGMLIAGAAFIIGAILTPIEVIGYNGSNKPFFRQGARAYAIIGGSIIFTAGIVITISDN